MEISNPVISNPVISNPVISNPVISNPVISNPVIFNPVISSDLFSKRFSIGSNPTQKVNFRCKINNTDYYLANMQMSENTNKIRKNNMQKDCGFSALVLIPVDELKNNLENYLVGLGEIKDDCATESKRNCMKQLKINKNQSYIISAEDEAECTIPPHYCNYKRFYIHDFIIQEVSGQVDKYNPVRKYLFKGTYTPTFKNAPSPTMINQQIYYDDIVPEPIPIVCGDEYPYGNEVEYKNQYGEVLVSESVGQEGIIEGQENIKVKLLMNTQVKLSGKDKNGVPTYIPLPEKMESSYIGVCKEPSGSTDIDFTFKSTNGKSYKRICLISTNLTSSSESSRVLEFSIEPVK
jgi:hypothetical protein